MTEQVGLGTLPDIPATRAFIRAIDTGEITLELSGDAPVLRLADRPPTRYERWVKPVMDRVLAAVLLVVLSPVLALTALAVRLTLGSGVLYRQRRVGLHGQPFEIVKFRTMHEDRRTRRAGFEGPDRRRTHKTSEDPRHTRLGGFLRRASIDELPQLWNVLRGEMSLVGPRPELVGIVDNYADWQHRRHDVRPGLTGLWQVTERDEEGNMHLHVATDIVYVANVSFALDLRLLLLTIPAILRWNGLGSGRGRLAQR